jgi:2-polyprenyl-3-methyl-5-hydroxy-6-metoxy-1,4-benzoquinol methylase
MNNYFLPENYTHRIDNSYFDDTPYKDEYQDDVYQEAKRIVDEFGYKKIVDIGTGGGYKLIKYFNDKNTIGVDLQPTIEFLKKTYPDKSWCSFEELDSKSKFDLFICSDVIEHVSELDGFIKKLNSFNFKHIVFSTPDKLQMYGCEHMGPPSNPSHVREWNMSEISNLLGEYYTIKKHFKSDPNSNTQIIVCSKK